VTTPLTDLLDELLRTHGPCGQEDAVRDVVRRELEPLADEVTADAAGNLVALLHGTDRSAPPVRVMAHLDELSMVVERIDPDGTLRVTSLGVMYPGDSGLGPVAVLGRRETLTGVLTLGSEHTIADSSRIWLGGGPVVAYADDAVVHDRAVADALVDVGPELGQDPQTAVWQSSDSDASQSKASGAAPRAALLSLPTLSTHGQEVLHSGTVDRTARLLAAFLARPLPVSG
jgi:putative aminopeptidase FrvX